MANISVKGVLFPSPSVAARQINHQGSPSHAGGPIFSNPGVIQHSSGMQPNFNQFAYSTASTAGSIQFPSPYYTPSAITDPHYQQVNFTMPSDVLTRYNSPPVIMSSVMGGRHQILQPPSLFHAESTISSSMVAGVQTSNFPSMNQVPNPSSNSTANLVKRKSTSDPSSNLFSCNTSRCNSALISKDQPSCIQGTALQISPRHIRGNSCKRKCDCELRDEHSCKVFINEEGISAKMRQLQLQQQQPQNARGIAVTSTRYSSATDNAAYNVSKSWLSSLSSSTNSYSLLQGARTPSSLRSLAKACITSSSNQPRPLCTKSVPRRTQKRKSSEIYNCETEGKVFIHEDRMAAGMMGLRLASEDTAVGKEGMKSSAGIDDIMQQEDWFEDRSTGIPIIEDEDTQDSLIPDSDDDLETEERTSLNDGRNTPEPRLLFSNELKIGLKNQELLPKFIQDEINKSQMQLVLWKPPGDQIMSIMKNMRSNPDLERPLTPAAPHSRAGVDIDLNMQEKPVMSPPVWSIPAGTQQSDMEVVMDSHIPSQPIIPLHRQTSTDHPSSPLNILPPSWNSFNDGGQISKASTLISNGGILSPIKTSNVRNPLSSSLPKFDFSLGSAFWNQNCNNGVDEFIACSTPTDVMDEHRVLNR